MFKRKRTIKLHSIFNKDSPEYIHYKITPDYDVKNSNNDSISKAMSNMYKTPWQRAKIDINGVKITYELKRQCYFNIIIVHGNAYFYMSIPKEYKDLIYGKMKTVWNNAAIQEVDASEINNFQFENCDIAKLILKDYNFKSLDTSKKDLFPLTNMLGVTRDLLEDEKVMINLSISPLKRTDVVNSMKDEYKSFVKGKTVDNEISTLRKAGGMLEQILQFGLSIWIEVRLLVFESLLGLFNTHEEKDILEVKIDSIEAIKQDNKLRGLSPSTTHKLTSEAFDVDISIVSQSRDKDRRNINLLSVANSYKDLSGDNELIVKKQMKKQQEAIFKSVTNFKSNYVPFRKKVIFSEQEVAKFIQLPQISLQQEYKLENISNKETEVSSILLNGSIPMGSVFNKFEEIPVKWYDYDLDKFMLPKVWQGYSRCGKTTALKNFVVDTSNAGYWNLVIDVNEGDLVDDAVKYISDKIPNEKIIVLDFSKYIYKLGLTEMLNTKGQNLPRLSGKVGDIMGYLLDSINNEPLSDRMKRYFNSAVRMCIVNGYTGVEDFRRALEDHMFRQDLINESEGKIRDKVIQDMIALTKYGKNGEPLDTKWDMIGGILDRLSVLVQNDILEDIFMSEPNQEIDFYKWFNEGYFVGIKAPKGDLFIETVNMLITFIVQKAWCAILMRHGINKKDRLGGFITLDEPHSFPYVAEILTGAIRESAKYRCGFNFAVHDLKDLGVLLPKLKAAGNNFMIFETDTDNIKHVEKLIKPFDENDILNLKQYHAIHSLVYGGTRIVQDIKTLPELKDRFKATNRRMVDCYGIQIDT